MKKATSDFRTCPKCGQQKPRTEQFWYFKQSGRYRGQVTGYCKKCQNSYCRQYDHAIVRPEQLARRRLQQRDWQRRKKNYNPEHYRVSVYEALLAGEPIPRPSDEQAAS